MAKCTRRVKPRCKIGTRFLLFTAILLAIPSALFFFESQNRILSNSTLQLALSSIPTVTETSTPLMNGNGIRTQELVIPKRRNWLDFHDSVLDKIQNHIRLNKGSVALPPSLVLPERVRQLENGVLLVGTGTLSYLENEIIPLLQYWKTTLELQTANEREQTRRGELKASAMQTAAAHAGYAALLSQEFKQSELFKPYASFFDVVYCEEELPDWPIGWRKAFPNITFGQTKPDRSKGRAKAVKAHALASSPFNNTVFVDWDTYPCRMDFVSMLAQIVGETTNFAMQDNRPHTIPVSDDLHWRYEHNSALAVWNMRLRSTRLVLSWFVLAFQFLWEETSWNPRDQSAMLIALRLAASPSFRDLQIQEKLQNFNHVDIPTDLFRRNVNEQNRSSCSKDQPDLFVHKPCSMNGNYTRKALRRIYNWKICKELWVLY